MLKLKEEQTWAPIRTARNLGSRASWEKHRGTLAHSLSTPAFISLSAAFEGLTHAAGAAAERPDDARLTDAEGWSLASTFLAMNRGMSYLTLLVDVPPRWRPTPSRRPRQAPIGIRSVNSPRGVDRNRTGVDGFAGRCVATPPRRLVYPLTIASKPIEPLASPWSTLVDPISYQFLAFDLSSISLSLNHALRAH
jgi:hypothetical protein